MQNRFSEILRASLARKVLLYTFFAFLLNLFCTGLEMFVPLIIGWIVDALGSASTFNQIQRPLVWMVVISFLQIPASYLLMRLTIRLKKDIAFSLSQELAERIKNARKNSLMAKGGAYLQQRIREDVSLLVDSFFDYVVNILIKLISLVVIGVLIYRISPAILCIFVAAMPFYVVIVILFKNPLYRFGIIARETYAEFVDAFAAQFDRIPFIKLHAIYAETKELARSAFKKSLTAIDREAQVVFIYSSSGWIVKVLAHIALIYQACVEIIAKSMTIGQLTVAMSYMSQFIDIAQFLLSVGHVWQSARVSLDRIYEVWELPQERRGGEDEFMKLDMIELRQLTYIADDNRALFTGLDYTFVRGKIYCICGYNGSGKSTLLSLISGLENGYTGAIYLNGREIAAIDMKKFRKHQLAAVEQHPLLYFKTIDAILSPGGGGEGVNHLPLHWPISVDWLEILRQREKEQPICWEKIFSGGEKQRLAIARAMIKNGSLWLFDEPTSALDVESSKAFKDILEQQKHDKIIIIVTHDPGLLCVADEILHLGGGHEVRTDYRGEDVVTSVSSSPTKMPVFGPKN